MRLAIFLFTALLAHADANALTKSGLVVPEFLNKLPHDAYHKHLSSDKVIGKTEFHWSVDGDEIRFDENSEMKLTLFNKAQFISTVTKTWTNSKLETQKFLFQMKTGAATIEIDGRRLKNKLTMKISQAGQVQTKELTLEEPVVMSALIRPFLLMKGLPQKSIELKAMMLEPSALTMVPLSMTVTKSGDNLWKVKTDYLQHQMMTNLSGNGSLLSQTSDLAGLKIDDRPVLAAEFKSLAIEGTRSDLVELAKVQFPAIPNSKNLKKLSVKISGLDFKSFDLTRHRQNLNGDALTITVEDLPKTSQPVQSLVGQSNLDVYLQGDAMTEVRDPLIQKTALGIVGKEFDLLKRAVLILNFVYREIEKNPTVSIPNALEVLKTKKGDCNEHAVLFTALARAAGIPTRTVVGLVYSGGSSGTPGFFYHAWVEVYVGTGWLSMDPTWNEVPVDATHMAFVEGGLDQQVAVTSLMGKIKLSLVSLGPASL